MKSMLLFVANGKCSVHIVCKFSNVIEKIKRKIREPYINKYVFFYEDFENALIEAKKLLEN